VIPFVASNRPSRSEFCSYTSGRVFPALFLQRRLPIHQYRDLVDLLLDPGIGQHISVPGNVVGHAGMPHVNSVHRYMGMRDADFGNIVVQDDRDLHNGVSVGSQSIVCPTLTCPVRVTVP